MLSLLPFILFGMSWGFWNILKLINRRIKEDKTDYFGRSIATLVIALFLVHPSIAQTMFYNFKCIEIDQEKRVMDDMQVICWNHQHKFFSYFVAVPSIVVWGLGIPFFALILLTRLRKDLDVLETREKYGFLYRGYRKEFYFWEIIIMYRKIALIFIAVFISAYGTIAQALIVFLFLIM